jgi:hypothetical protein
MSGPNKTERRKLGDAYLRQYGWRGGRGEWRHPWLTGMFTKFAAMTETQHNPKIQQWK